MPGLPGENRENQTGACEHMRVLYLLRRPHLLKMVQIDHFHFHRENDENEHGLKMKMAILK